MPQINLLLTAAGKKKKARSWEGPKAELTSAAPAFVPILYVIIAILLLVWLVLSFIITKEKRELSILEKKVNSLTVSPAQIKNINLNKEQLSNKAVLLENLSSRKFFWAEKLEKISDFVLRGIWLTEISLNKLVSAATDSKKEKGKENQPDRYMLTIKGCAFAYKIQDAITLIGKFNNLLKEDEDFSQDFSKIKLNNVAKSLIGKTDIMNFEFNLILR